MDSYETCMKLLRAESEKEVSDIIENTPKMRDPDNWNLLDNRGTHWGVISGQASDGAKALTELMTNMVDAILMKRSYEENIDPRGKSAPQNMYDAVDRFIKNLHGGKLISRDFNDPWLKEFSEKNLVIGLTGAKSTQEGNPCYTFVDNGEGQSPPDFPNTFLSLSAPTKGSIPFVQGKYNMGSSGVIIYCGDKWYKLIVSRRYDKNSPWGWTLIRRMPSSKDSQPVTEYFIPKNEGMVSSFDRNIIYPFQTGNKEIYKVISRESGTIVKLYDYWLGSDPSRNRFREALYENLVETILPFRLLDFRQEESQTRATERSFGIDPRPFYGMEFHLLRDRRKGHEDESYTTQKEPIFVDMIDDPDFGTIKITAMPLKKKIPSWLTKSPQNRIYHTVNGQVQYKQLRGYLSLQCNLTALKDRVIIIVDASKLNTEAHNRIWKSDRETINKTPYGQKYIDIVTQRIKNSDVLREMHEEIAKEELSRVQDEKGRDLFQQLVDVDPIFAQLLTDRDPSISLASGNRRDRTKSVKTEFVPKYNPTYIRIRGSRRQFQTSDAGQVINAETDAGNDYFTRPDNEGKLMMSNSDINDRFQIAHSLKDGRLAIFITPRAGYVSIADQYTTKLGLSDPSMAEPVWSDEVNIVIIEKAREPKEVKPRPVKPVVPNKVKKPGKAIPEKGIPPFMLLTEDGRNIDGHGETVKWSDMTDIEGGPFTESDGGVTKDLGDDRVIHYINYDNTWHLNSRKKISKRNGQEAVTQKYILGMRILLFGYQRALDQMLKGQGEVPEVLHNHRDLLFRLAARGAASVVLPLADTLPRIVDLSGAEEEAE